MFGHWQNSNPVPETYAALSAAHSKGLFPVAISYSTTPKLEQVGACVPGRKTACGCLALFPASTFDPFDVRAAHGTIPQLRKYLLGPSKVSLRFLRVNCSFASQQTIAVADLRI